MKRRTIKLLVLGIMILVLLVYGEAYTETDSPKAEGKGIKNITPKEARILIEKNKDNPDLVVLDVRTPEEFSEGHIEGAINLDFYSPDFREELGKLDRSRTYITHCRSGKRSEKTIEMMNELGFREVYNMEGGIIRWIEEGLPITKEADNKIPSSD